MPSMEKVGTVKSSTDRRKHYSIFWNATAGHYFCTCPGYEFRHTCHHITEWEKTHRPPRAVKPKPEPKRKGVSHICDLPQNVRASEYVDKLLAQRSAEYSAFLRREYIRKYGK